MKNTAKTALLLGGLSALLLIAGQAVGGQQGLMIAFGFAALLNFGSYWFSDKLVLRMYRAKEVGPEHPLSRIVARLVQRAGLPMPKVYTIPTNALNAFATGRNPAHAAVAATDGIIANLSERELEGVMAHELAHVKNRDTLISAVAATIAAMLIQAAISRSREFGADRGGAEIAGSPQGLADALRKLEVASIGLGGRLVTVHVRPPSSVVPTTFEVLVMRITTLSALLLAALGCGDGTGPTDVEYGVTTFVVLANPIVNDQNQVAVPTPGTTRSGVSVSVADGPSGTTDATGVVVLSPIAAGAKALTLTGGGATGDVSVGIADKELREVAVALSGTTAQVMGNVNYAFGGTVVEITPSMSLADVNAVLAQSNQIVFFKAGTYTGDLEFTGSNVTLFGEGSQGGSVTLNGNVTVGGSQNRIRGARITGNLTVPGSNFGMSFTRVSGAFQLQGSGATLLNNGFCGTVTISGSGRNLLGNAGMAPIAAPSSC